MSRLRLALTPFLAVAAGVASSPWIEVPYVRQSRAGCGAASIAMVIQYWAAQNHRLAAAAAAAERINADLPAEADGISGNDLKGYLEQRGFDVFVFKGDRRALENEFGKRRPVVICFAPAGPRRPLHYAVVVGVGDDSVWLNDPAGGRLIREPLPRFETQWAATGNWSLVAVPRALP